MISGGIVRFVRSQVRESGPGAPGLIRTYRDFGLEMRIVPAIRGSKNQTGDSRLLGVSRRKFLRFGL